MNFFLKGLLLIFFAASISSCGGGDEKKERGKLKIGEKKETKKDDTKKEENANYDLTNKGVGPVSSVTLGETIDQTMAAEGAKIYKTKCTACHKIGQKFIGPPPNGVLDRRSPEWIMNMILDPEGMVKNDPDAKALFLEFNGSPMANQSLTEEEARKILEYFRTLDKL